MVHHLIVTRHNYLYSMLHHIITDAVMRYSHLCDWFFASCLLYVFMVRLIYVMTVEYFETLLEKFSCSSRSQDADASGDREVSSSQLCCQHITLNQSFRRLLQPLRWIVAACFFHVFIKSSATIMDMIDLQRLASEKVGIGLPLAYRLTVLLFLIVNCDMTADYWCKQSDRLLLLMMQHGHADRLRSFVQEIRVSRRLDVFNVCSIVYIDRSLIVSFIAALISTTVLLIEVANEIARRSSSSD